NALLSVLFTCIFCVASTSSQASHPVSSERGGSSVKRRFGIVKSSANAVVAIEAVRYLEEEDWYERLEVQVKNISNKPIYFLEVVLNFPDVVTTEIDGVH